MTDSRDYTADIRAAFVAFQAEVNRLSEEEVRAYPNGLKALNIARAICDASSGLCVGQTSRLTFGLPGQSHALGVKNTIAVHGQIRPAWWHFLTEAYTAIEHLGKDVPIERAVDLVTKLRDCHPKGPI